MVNLFFKFELDFDGLNIDDCSDIDKLIDEIKKIADTNHDIVYQVLGVENG